MVQSIKHLLIGSLLLSLMGCATTIDRIVIGKSTPRGNKIQVGAINFDNKWSALGGSLTCCWTWAGGLHGVNNITPPKSVYVKWYDYDPGIYYEATLQLSNDLYSLATNLPPYEVIHNKRVEEKPRPYLIIGFGETGEVVVWISNSARGDNIKGRVLHEVGRGQATIIQPDENGRG